MNHPDLLSESRENPFCIVPLNMSQYDKNIIHLSFTAHLIICTCNKR